jgi:hypothetical protein
MDFLVSEAMRKSYSSDQRDQRSHLHSTTNRSHNSNDHDALDRTMSETRIITLFDVHLGLTWERCGFISNIG